MTDGIFVLVNLGAAFGALLVAYLIGSALEHRHYRSILERERDYRSFPVTTFSALLPEWRAESAVLAQGSVVVSVDYFKRFVAALRGIFGGRLTSYEPLLDRARREAVLRMIEHARAQGCVALVNVRLETSRIANDDRNGRQVTAGVELLAYGTGIRSSR
jgi:uncharacterized protein YbjQ (UPF0145 family)